jgi:hypothetical protein
MRRRSWPGYAPENRLAGERQPLRRRPQMVGRTVSA